MGENIFLHKIKYYFEGGKKENKFKTEKASIEKDHFDCNY